MKNSVPLPLMGVSSPLVGKTVMSGCDPCARWAVNGSGCLGREAKCDAMAA